MHVQILETEVAQSATSSFVVEYALKAIVFEAEHYSVFDIRRAIAEAITVWVRTLPLGVKTVSTSLMNVDIDLQPTFNEMVRASVHHVTVRGHILPQEAPHELTDVQQVSSQQRYKRKADWDF